MKIVFVYTKGRPKAWVDRAFDLQHFGGSEGSMIRFAQEFAKLGHSVTIYTAQAETRWFAGVKWCDFESGTLYDQFFDVTIFVRFPHAPVEGSALKVLFCTDPKIPELQCQVARGLIDLIIVISEHQKQRFQEQHPIDEGLYLVSNAGVVCAEYDRDDVAEIPGRCIYCSVGERGLKHLVSIWPKVRREVPLATLHITGGYSLWGLDIPLQRQPVLQQLLALEGVAYLGVVSREKLIEEQLQSQVLLLPGAEGSPEMCCMAAMECAAAGNVLIVGDIAALPERVIEGKTGYVVKHEGDWQTVFAQKAVEALTSPNLQEMQALARAGERAHDYSVLAPEWIARFKEELNARR